MNVKTVHLQLVSTAKGVKQNIFSKAKGLVFSISGALFTFKLEILSNGKTTYQHSGNWTFLNHK